MKDLLLGLALFSLTAYFGFEAGEFHELTKQIAKQAAKQAERQKEEQAKVPEQAAPRSSPGQFTNPMSSAPVPIECYVLIPSTDRAKPIFIYSTEPITQQGTIPPQHKQH